MSSLQNNNGKMKESDLCQNCNTFYGNPHQENLCSKCYKDKFGATLPKKEGKPAAESMATEALDQKNSKMEECLQEDTSKCWNCGRKAGLLGYKCRCSYTFCKLHRLPEEHKCNFDFNVAGKEKIAQANPQIKASKLDKF